MKRLHYIILLLFIAQFAAAQPNWIWAKASDVQYDASGKDVVTDSAGNIYVAGNFWEPSITLDSITMFSQGQDDFFVAKYDPDGKVVWAKNFGGALSEKVRKMVLDNQGNLVICGYFNSSLISFDDDTLINHGDFDIFLVKMDTSGNSIWAKSIYSISEDDVSALEIDNNNNILVSGHCNNLPDVYFDTLVLPTPNWSFFLQNITTMGMCYGQRITE